MRCFPTRVRDDMEDVCALKVARYWWFSLIDGCLIDVKEETDGKLCCEDRESESGVIS